MGLRQWVQVLYYVEAAWMPWLQKTCHPSSTFLLLVTKVSDPKFAIFLLFPLTLYSTDFSLKILVAAACAEWLNIMLKLILMEDRPYWWIPDQSSSYGSPIEPLHQFPVTCETGPGSPSGHVMVSGAAWLMLVHACADLFKPLFSKPRCPSKSSSTSESLLMAGYYVALATVGISRVYIGAHFFHQCLLAAVIGEFVGARLSKANVRRLNFWSIAVAFATVGFLVSHFGRIIHDVEPDWSVKLAEKYCADPSWVRLDTTPLATVVRPVAVFVGLALTGSATRFRSSGKVGGSFWSVSRCVLGLVWSWGALTVLEIAHQVLRSTAFYLVLFGVVVAYVLLCFCSTRWLQRVFRG